MSARFPPSTCFLLMLFFHVHASNAFSLRRRRVESSHPNAWTPSAGTFQSKVRVFQKCDSSSEGIFLAKKKENLCAKNWRRRIMIRFTFCLREAENVFFFLKVKEEKEEKPYCSSVPFARFNESAEHWHANRSRKRRSCCCCWCWLRMRLRYWVKRCVTRVLQK